MSNLPSYIKARDPNTQSLAQRGLAVVGAGQGPYLSLKGDRFTLIDAAGNQQPIQTLHFDVCIIDINDHISKMYYESSYDPTSTEPPVCWSDNGVAPSSQVSAGNAQSLTCADCKQNVWGSKVSSMGSEVKACRDEQKVAIIVPGMPNNVFRLTIPPNSLKDWRAYLVKFQSAQFDIFDVVTRLTILPEGKKLQFNPAPTPWLDDATVACRDKALAAKASDIIVGRLDRPRQGASPAPSAAIPAVAEQQHPLPETQPFPTQPVVQPTAVQAAPVEAPRRRRRTNAEIAAANQAPPAAGGQAPAPAMAPFRPEAQPNGPAGPAFGVGQGVAPNPELARDIASIFGS